ncbi:MAG: N-acetyltransferase family protein [Lawsonibacter sp.]
MLTFRDVTPQDRDVVLPMVEAFYQTDAVDHSVETSILERSFLDAADPAEPLLRGILVLDGTEVAGYLYLTQCYAAEVGGRCIFIEEIYLNPPFRGRGLGHAIMAWIETQYPSARRFRLEVTPVNQGAVRLYKKSGYQYLRYHQMVLDKQPRSESTHPAAVCLSGGLGSNDMI